MDITQININIKTNLKAVNIFEPENFEAIKFFAYRFIDNSDYEGALRYGKILEEKLQNSQPQTQDEQYYFHILKYWQFRLELFAFSNFNLSEANAFFKNNALSVLNCDLDLRRAIYKMFSFYESDDIITDFAKNFVSAISANNELLGSNLDAFKGVNFKPSVSNWLKEYSTVLRSKSLNLSDEPGAFHIVKFVDTNQYVKLLNAYEKGLLRELCDLYNWLLYPFATEVKTIARGLSNTQTAKLPEDLAPKQNAVSPPPIPSKNLESKAPIAGINLKPNLPPLAKAKEFPAAPNKPVMSIDEKLADLKKKIV